MTSRAARRNRIVLGAILIVIFGVANLFGRELNALMLRWPGIDKILHFGAFALFFTVAYGLARTNFDPRRAALLVAGLGVVMSFSDEAVQAVTPGRNVELGDLMADWSGLAFGWAFAAAPPRRYAVPLACAALVAGASVSYASYARLHDISQARAHLRKADFLQARESLLKALAAGHRTAAVFNELAWADVESGHGEPEQAVRWAQTALEMTPDDPNVLDTYGWALHHAGRSPEAVEPLERAYQAMPGMFCIHYHLGAVYLAVGRTAEAEHHLRQQLNLPAPREAVSARRALETLHARQ